jgi:hypothetical protein
MVCLRYIIVKNVYECDKNIKQFFLANELIDLTTKVTIKVLKANKLVSSFSQTKQYVFRLFCLDKMFRSIDFYHTILTNLIMRCM